MLKSKRFFSLTIFLLILLVLITVIDFQSLNIKVYQSFYRQGLLNFEYNKYIFYIQNIFDYLRFKTELISDFSNRDIAHMLDVRNLYLIIHYLKYFLFIVISLYFILMFKFHKEYLISYIKFDLNKLLLKIFIPIIILIMIFVVSFDFFWINFHYIFFSNDLWLLDPSTSLLINLVPSEFFIFLINKIIISFFILVLIIYIILKLIVRWMK